MIRFQTSIGVLLLIAAASLGGCAESADETTSERSATDGSTTGRAAVETSQRFETIVVPEGTTVLVSLDTPVTTEVNRTGDPFVATTVEPIVVDGVTAIPSGSKIHGTLQDVQSSGRVAGRARMTLAFQAYVDSESQRRAISALPLQLQAASTTGSDVEKIAAGGVVGGVVGGIVAGGKGAVIGAGAGVGAGTILMLATKGDDLELNVGQRLSVRLSGPTNVRVTAER